VYRKVLESQVQIRQETGPLAEAAELTRRDRQTARALGERQETVRAELGDLLARTTELAEAKVFEHAHKRLDSLATRARTSLDEAQPRTALASQDSIIRGVKDLLDALEDPEAEDRKFSDGAEQQEGGGGGGGGSGGAIPPQKELRLLRSIQTALAERTAELAERGEEARREDIEEVAADQRDLMGVGQELLDRLQQKQGQPSRIEGEGGDVPLVPEPAPPEKAGEP
jgi:hypothetical protein